ncbi:MAG: response regulator [Microthrixaceae bacterium]
MGSRKDESWNGTERRQPPTVLIVNDEHDARELLVRFLRQAGFSVEGAERDTAAMSLMVDQLPRCVVLDMQAGGVGTSLKILDQIRTHPDRRVNTSRVILCAPSPKNRTFSFQSGADAFLIRPFHLKDLIAHINDVISRPQDERARHRRDELARTD